MVKHFLILTLLFGVVNLAYGGLDPQDKFGHIVALYHFEDTSDSGARQLDGYLSRDAKIVKSQERGNVLRLRNRGSFHVHSDFDFPLPSEFSVVFWVKLKKQNDEINIGMHGSNADGRTAGYASITIKPDGNFYGWHYASAENQLLLETEDENISDNKWHHIAFTRYGDTTKGIYTIYIDGKAVGQSVSRRCLCFIADKTNVYITNTDAEGILIGDVFVDEVGFFSVGFSVHEVRAIYSTKLNWFIKTMPVDPRAKIATTWGTIKGRN